MLKLYLPIFFPSKVFIQNVWVCIFRYFEAGTEIRELSFHFDIFPCFSHILRMANKPAWNSLEALVDLCLIPPTALLHIRNFFIYIYIWYSIVYQMAMFELWFQYLFCCWDNFTYEFCVGIRYIWYCEKRIEMDFHNSEGIKIENREICDWCFTFVYSFDAKISIIIDWLFGGLFWNYNGIVSCWHSWFSYWIYWTYIQYSSFVLTAFYGNFKYFEFHQRSNYYQILVLIHLRCFVHS